MKFATLDNQTRDGQVVVVCEDGAHYHDVSSEAPSLQWVLDHWERCLPVLQRCVASKRPSQALPLQWERLLAPLPRAYEWLDGSAYLNHVRLARRARGAALPDHLETSPLMYQGGSGVLLSPRADIELPNEDWGLDLEGELCVILSDVPRGTSKDEARSAIRLITIANDLSYRNLIREELDKGFGFVISKPATSFAPIAVTPDELAQEFAGGRLEARLHCMVNDNPIGSVRTGPGMHFSFFDLIAHVAQTRSLTAGTLLGSGTVSDAEDAPDACCLAEIRAQEMIRLGRAVTPYLEVGDRVRIWAETAVHGQPFGQIQQRVVAPAPRQPPTQLKGTT